MTPSSTNYDSVSESTLLASNKITDPHIDNPTNITNQLEPPLDQGIESANPSYILGAQNSNELNVVEKLVSTSFKFLKKLHDKGITRSNNCVDFSDDDTV